MTLQEEPYAASNGYADSLPLEESDHSPQPSSGSPGGTDYQKLVAEAMSSSEFSDQHVGGVPIRRQGRGLHIPYDSALEMLGWGGSNGYSSEHE